MQPLTKRQRQVYEFIGGFIKVNGFAPTLEEIAAGMHLSAIATVHKHLEQLKMKGWIRRRWGHSRSMELAGQPGCCPMCGRDYEKGLDKAKVSIEVGRKVCDDKSVEKGLAGPIPT